MDKRRYLSLSVHQLVDVLLRQGDIDDRVYNQETMAAGSRLHGEYQSKQGESYLSELPLSCRVEVEEGVITLTGRADGVIVGGRYPIIDEIKTTIAPVEEFALEQESWHLGQAACYAYMYLRMQGGDKCGVRLTYFHQINTDDKLIKDFEFSFFELEKMVKGYCSDYLRFLSQTFSHYASRDASSKDFPFPYNEFRKGQRELARYVYGAAKKGGTLFVEAPTGIGKTMSTLFPAAKAFEEGRFDKVFYLTAKNTGSLSALKAAEDIASSGLDLWYVRLLAKERICFTPGAQCNPDECPYAKGYFGKLRNAIKDALESGGHFDSATVTDLAMKHELCPFEFQLDLSNHCDVVIADYNYFFDPIVHLERYFDETVDSSTYFALIDEAHNLLDRGRDMYSAELSTSVIHAARKSLKGDSYKGIRVALAKIEKALEDVASPFEEPRFLLESVDEGLIKTIANWKAAFQRASKKKTLKTTSEYREFSRLANRFSRIHEEHFDASYRVYGTHFHDDVTVRMLCIDPCAKLKESVEKVKGAVLFSATMSPIDYQMDALLGDKSYPYLLLSSPFPKQNMKLMVASKVSVRYKDRESSREEVAAYLKAFVEGKMGNYFVFFPSYEYMQSILPSLDFGDAEVLAQSRQMTHRERDEFLRQFGPNPDHTKVGLLILGGAFSEGIDLVDDRLIGVAVVGIGLPQIGMENDLIRAYHDQKSGQGFAYAYKDPGMNKVLQAVGRLIRSETDVGAALLIDDRYLQREYRELFSRIYDQYEVVTSPSAVAHALSRFYKR
ncbi:MAG: PD-(D/E)XK nuclease family protein [Bacilli bacterium]|nr:PD-(D/E)XK nuclease family protein [Bacilli bacterium]